MNENATIRGHEQILERTSELLHSFTPPGFQLRLPPPSVQAFDMRYEEYIPGQSMTATLTVSENYANPVGLLQGGFLAAMFDNLIGPLAYLTARGPTTSLEMSTHFLRPVFPGEQLRLTTVVRKAGRAAIYIAGEAHNGDNKLVATVMSTVQVLPMPT